MRLNWIFGTLWDVLGHIGTLWDDSEDILLSLEHLDCFPSRFRPFSPIIGSLKKNAFRTDGQTDGRTDGPSYRDAWTHLKRSPFIRNHIFPLF